VRISRVALSRDARGLGTCPEGPGRGGGCSATGRHVGGRCFRQRALFSGGACAQVRSVACGSVLPRVAPGVSSGPISIYAGKGV